MNDGEADEAGEYKARKRAREVFGARFVVLHTGEQRPDHTGNMLYYICMSVCMYVCIYIHSYICIYVYTYICMYACIYTCIYI